MKSAIRRAFVVPCFTAMQISFVCCTTVAGADLWSASVFTNGVFRINDQTGAFLPNDIPGGFPTGSAGLAFASGVTVGPDGNIYVSSQGTGQILFYSGITGAPLTQPAPGSTMGVFATLVDATSPMPGPSHLLFGPDGHLYVSDFNSTRVRKFNGTTGAVMPDAGTAFTQAGGLAFGPDGDLYIGDFSGANVIRMHNGIPQIFVAPQAGGLFTPTSLLFTAKGELLVVDVYGNQVLKYDSNGQPVPRFAPADTNHEHPLPFIVLPPDIPPNWQDLGATAPTNSPSDIAFDKDGNLVISVLGLTYPPDNRGAIYRYDLDGNLLATITTGIPPIGGIAFGWNAGVPVPGDYDGDLTVDGDDYNKWRQDFGKFVAKHLGADGNGNGVVDAADYSIWRNAMASGSGSNLGAAVPEPGTIACLLAFATLAIAPRMRRR